MEVKSFLRHVFQRRRPVRNLVRTKGFVTSYLDLKFVSITLLQMIRRFCQDAKSTEHVEHILSSHPLVSSWIRNRPTNNASPRRTSVSSLFRSVRERVVVGSQTTAFVVSCDTAGSSPLTSILNFLQRSKSTHRIDASATVTCLVHGHVAESHRVGCCFEYVRRCWVIEIPDPLFQISTLQPGQELVDPLKTALVHEDQPIADSCLGRHSSFECSGHDRPTREKWHQRWDTILLSQCLRL